jgi:hypothetical protein
VAERSTNTLEERVTKFLGELGKLKADPSLSPDDLADVFEVEAFFIERARRPIKAMQQSGLLPQGGGPGPQLGGGMPGLASGAPIGEMARALQQPAGNFQ